jgi:hypothetical protein
LNQFFQRAAEVGAEESALKAQKARQGTVKSLPWECEENQSIVAEDLMEKVRQCACYERFLSMHT